MTLTYKQCDAISTAVIAKWNADGDKTELFNELILAVAAAASVPRETAWLVELRSCGVFKGWLIGGYVVDDRNRGWTIDPNKAIRFCRKEDADAYRERHGFTFTSWGATHLSTEHIWLDAAPAEKK
jgi:hypothetical protein